MKGKRFEVRPMCREPQIKEEQKKKWVQKAVHLNETSRKWGRGRTNVSKLQCVLCISVSTPAPRDALGLCQPLRTQQTFSIIGDERRRPPRAAAAGSAGRRAPRVPAEDGRAAWAGPKKTQNSVKPGRAFSSTDIQRRRSSFYWNCHFLFHRNEFLINPNKFCSFVQ